MNKHSLFTINLIHCTIYLPRYNIYKIQETLFNVGLYTETFHQSSYYPKANKSKSCYKIEIKNKYLQDPDV